MKDWWEHGLVEKPFCKQLELMGWQWLQGDTEVPEFTERNSFREVLLKDRLRAAVHKINLGPDGQPWLDDGRVDRAVRELEQLGAHSLMEANRAATELLLGGTSTEGLPGWNEGRNQPLRFIDFDNWQNNNFLAINQFKVELSSGQGHIIADAVLFVNGIPLVVGEFKNPGIEDPIGQAINQLLRYSNQRKELYPTLYTENEGVERLFHYNQCLIVSDFFEARVGTIAAPPEAYLEWLDTSPVPLATVAQEVGLIPGHPDENDAAMGLVTMGSQRGDLPGVPLFFRSENGGKANNSDQATRLVAVAGSPQLHSQQLLVAGVLRPAHFLDTVRNFTLFKDEEGKTQKIVAHYQQFRAVHATTRRLLEGRTKAQGAVRDERGGIVWHTQGSGKSLTMVFLVRKMRSMETLKRFKVVVVTDRTDLEKQIGTTARLTGETVRPSDVDKRSHQTPTALTQRILAEPTPDIVLAMIQKYQEREQPAREKVEITISQRQRLPGKDSKVMEKEVTYEEDIHFEDFPVLNESEEILVLVDEAHRSHTRALHRNLRKALPNAAIVGFTGTPILSEEKTETREIFGDFIDRYLLRDAELDGATVPILYEGRTAEGLVKDAPTLDQLFEDMFRDYAPQELAAIKAKYATAEDVLETPLLIEQKARDMLRHYVGVVLPERFKAQIVATSRLAAIRYLEKLRQARRELIEQLEAMPATTLALNEDEVERLDTETKFLVRAHRQLPFLRAIEMAVVVSGEHNDPESWRHWTDKAKQEDHIAKFKRRLAPQRTDKTDPLAVVVVNNMLLTGFDAPVEQVMYLDRKVVAHDLLQAIARVNRTATSKRCGYVVDYIGVMRHLNEALKNYDSTDIEGELIDIMTMLPILLDRRARAVGVFASRGVTDLKAQVQDCVFLLEDLPTRADFINKLRQFFDTLNILQHRPEVPGDVFRDGKLLGFVNKVAANLYRDPALNLLGVAEKVKMLIDRHVSARGVDPKIPPVSITDTDFENALAGQGSARARAAEMQHAARFHIVGFESHNPAYALKMSQKLQEILRKFKDDWEALERELRKFINELRQGDRYEFPDLDARAQVPFVRLLLAEGEMAKPLTDGDRKAVIGLALDVVERLKQEVRKRGFWKDQHAREVLTRRIVQDLDAVRKLIPPAGHRELAQRLVALARENHEYLAR